METEIILPRLTLSYYFLFAIFILAVFFIAWLLLKNRETARNCIIKVVYLAGSYIVAQISFKGFRFSTHTFQADFIRILLRTIVIYLLVLIAAEIFNGRKKIKDS